MNKKILTLIFFLLSFDCVAQQKIKLKYKACGYNNEIIPDAEITSYNPENYILEEISKICKSVVLQPNFIVRKSTSISIAVSGVDELDHRIIYYNPDFFHAHSNQTYQIAILAHEIGHQLNSHTFTNNKRPQDELAADQFTGNVIFKLKLNLGDVRRLLIENCATQGNSIYPPLSERISAVITGYDLAGGHIATYRTTEDGPMVRDKEGHHYPTFKFDGLYWLGKNLQITTEEAFVFNDIDTSNMYGVFYSFNDAKIACSKLGTGWRLPTFLEYQHLFGSNNGGYTDYHVMSSNDPHGNPRQGYLNNIEGGSTGFNSLLAGTGFSWNDQVIDMHVKAGYWAADIPNNPIENDYEKDLYLFSFIFNKSTFEIAKDRWVSHLPDRFSCRCVTNNIPTESSGVKRHRVGYRKRTYKLSSLNF